jgi:hypothetical protein
MVSDSALGVSQDGAKGGNSEVQTGETTLPVRTACTPASNQTLTGKQEHYLKRELISEQVKWEISELNSTTALRRFGAPFKSPFGEVSPLDSELPILRYIFVHHVREFPFLDKANEKEFWQDKLQMFLESFASKNISSSEDRLEETKRRKLATKAKKLVELMMVSGVPTSSGFEERIRFSDLEIVDANAIDTGVLSTIPEGNYINGWDVNVAGVRIISAKRNIRHHKHAEFILRVRRKGAPEHYIGRRYGDFARLHTRLRTELPGKVLPPLPRKNKSNSTFSGYGWIHSGNNSETSSISSMSTAQLPNSPMASGFGHQGDTGQKLLSVKDQRSGDRLSPRSSVDGRPSTPSLLSPKPQETTVLPRENQRISLRAFLRTLLHNPQIAGTKAIEEFLSTDPICLTDEDVEDISRRKHLDKKRVEEQKQFYEVARKRAAELDVYMEQ